MNYNMGSYISTIFSRIFHFPIQRKPICYFRQEDFSSTGVPLVRQMAKRKMSTRKAELDDFQIKFYSNLLRERRLNREQKGRSSSMKQSVRDYPGWDETTLSNIHSLFLLFNNRENGMLNFINLVWERKPRKKPFNIVYHSKSQIIQLLLALTNFSSAILESLGDTNTYEEKRKHFDLADGDNDGWLSYDDFVKLMYYMNPMDPDTEEITGVARLCRETAENIKFVTALRVGEQLEYGLF